MSLPKNSIGLDSGTGNGKYLPLVLPSGSVMLGLDRSMGLLEHAKAQAWQESGGMECLRGDLGWGGWRSGVFVCRRSSKWC
jgi:tRNA (uracil-5-)-methyltransferase TRM9